MIETQEQLFNESLKLSRKIIEAINKSDMKQYPYVVIKALELVLAKALDRQLRGDDMDIEQCAECLMHIFTSISGIVLGLGKGILKERFDTELVFGNYFEELQKNFNMSKNSTRH